MTYMFQVTPRTERTPVRPQLCSELTIREAMAIYGRGSLEHHTAINHAAMCKKTHG